MNSPRNNGPAIPRRGFFALGGAGAAGLALAACGTEVEEPNDERDIEILAAALTGEENAASALKTAQPSAGAEEETVRALAQQAEAHATRLQDLLADLNATPEGEFGIPESDGLDGALLAAGEQTNIAIAAYARGAGQLTEEFRADALELIVAAGARLAVLAELLGIEPAPFAFATGLEEEPHQTTDDGDEETTSTETTSTTTEEEGS